MSPETEKLIKEMTAIIVRELDPKQVILFSFHAKRAPRSKPDLNLLIVRDHPLTSDYTRREHSRLLDMFPVIQDILVCTLEETELWKQSKVHIIARALREGKILYERA